MSFDTEIERLRREYEYGANRSNKISYTKPKRDADIEAFAEARLHELMRFVPPTPTKPEKPKEEPAMTTPATFSLNTVSDADLSAELARRGFANVTPEALKAEAERRRAVTATSIVARTKSDLGEAAFVVAAEKITRAVQLAISKAVKQHGGDDHTASFLTTLFTSTYGAAGLSLCAGHLIAMAPTKMVSDPRLTKLADVMRIQGSAALMSGAIDLVLAEIMPALPEILNSLPAESAAE